MGRNNVVIKTTPGMASAVAVVLDHTNHDMMLGTVAGDDTLLVIAKTNSDAEIIMKKLRTL